MSLCDPKTLCADHAADLLIAGPSGQWAPLGVLCLTLCPPCATFGEVPRVAVGTAARLVGHHCAHLGITVDDMAAALETEQ